MTRIMILSNSPHIHSGYSQVISNLAVALKGLGHDISITGMQSSYSMGDYKGIPVYPLLPDFHSVGNPQTQIYQLIMNIKTHRSDILLCMFQGDSMYNSFTKVHQNTVWYMPVEGEIVYKDHPVFNDARGVKQVVALTHSAGSQFTIRGIGNKVIYPGFNPKIFRRNYRKDLREPVAIYFPKQNEEVVIPANSIPELKKKLGIDCFLGFVGQNFGVKKRIELLIEAFSIFAKGKSDVHLHLHTLPVHNQGINLFEIIDYFDIRDKITFSYGNIRSSGWSESCLNILYNTFDIYATASSGGGFELPNFESATLGVPQVAPNFIPFNELYPDGDRGLLCKTTRQMTQAGEFRALADVEDLAQKMEMLYNDKGLRKKLGDSCAKWSAQYTWTKCAEKFDDLFRSIMQGK